MTRSTKDRTLEEAASEVERELSVRTRCYSRWIDDGKMSRVDAQDRYDRLATALEWLNALSALSPADFAAVDNLRTKPKPRA